MMSEIARQPLSDTQIDTKYAEALEYATGRNEFVMIPLMLARRALKLLHAPKSVLVGGVLATTIFATQGGEVSATADMDTAQTTVEAELIQFKADTKIEAATASWSLEMVAQKIPFIINRPAIFGIDTVPDCERNKYLKGIGTNEFQVPLSAVTSVEGENGKTDFVIDGSKLEIDTHWEGKDPSIVNYEVGSDGKRDFGDQGDFCMAWNGLNAVLGDQELQNTMVTLDNRIEDDMKLKSLDILSKQCAPKLNVYTKEAIENSIEKIVSTMGKSEQMGEVRFQPETFTWNEVKVPAPLVKKTENATYTYQLKEEGFKVDKVNCEINPQIAQGAR